MYEVGELVKWRCPLDADYSYGYIVEIKRNQEKSSYSDWHRILQRSYHRNTS